MMPEKIRIYENEILIKIECSKCRNVKSILEFTKNNARKDGFNPYCKTCVKSINKEDKYKTKRLSRESKRREKITTEILKNKKCKSCGKKLNTIRKKLCDECRILSTKKIHSEYFQKNKNILYQKRNARLKKQNKFCLKCGTEIDVDSHKKLCEECRIEHKQIQSRIRHQKRKKINNLNPDFKEKEKLRHKEYYKNNKEKINKKNKLWGLKNKEKLSERIKLWRKNNIEKVRKNKNEWRKNNETKINGEVFYLTSHDGEMKDLIELAIEIKKTKKVLNNNKKIIKEILK